MCHPAKVSKSFTATASATGPTALKENKQVDERHRKWLKRHATTAKQGWRPRKIYRLSSKHWLAMWDNELQVSTTLDGLKSLQFQEDDPAWSPSSWRTWQFCQTAQDQGGDGCCGWHAAAYHLQLNTSAVWDWAHGCCRDVELCYKHLDKFTFLLLTMIIVNVGHGPGKDEGMRFQQLQESIDHYFKTFSPHTSSLLAAHSTAILEEMEGELDVTPGETTLEALWQWLQHNHPYRKKGEKVKLCQFMGIVNGCKSLLKGWSMRLIFCEYLALEMDMLQGKDFREKILIKQQTLQHAADLTTTSESAPQVDAKVLRSCCQNALVISLMVLSVDANRRLIAVLVHTAYPVNKWMNHAIRQLKGVETTHEWIKEQFVVGFINHLNEIMQVLKDGKILMDCGFFQFKHSSVEDTTGLLMMDEELAALQGSMVVMLMAKRLTRTLYFFGSWPGKTFQFMIGDAAARAAIKEFRNDFDTFNHLQAMDRKPKGLQKILDRSVMNLVVNKQWAVALVESDWEPTPGIIHLAEERSRAAFSSLPCENMFNIQKNRRQQRGRLKVSVPPRVMGIVLGSEVLEKVCKYSVVPSHVPLEKKSLKLAKESFGGGTSQPSIDIGSVASHASTAPWFSPKPENVCKPAVDLAFLEFVKAEGTQPLLLDQAYLGCFCEATIQIIFKKEGSGGQSFGWHCGLANWGDTAVMAWPCTVHTVPGQKMQKYITLSFETQQPSLLTILSWEGIVAIKFKWHSWNWQVQNVEGIEICLEPGARAFLDGEELALKELAARSAWWHLGISDLHNIAKYLKADVKKSDSLFQCLLQLAMHVLKCSEKEAMDIISQRLVQMQAKNDFSQELLDIDEAVNCLEKNDMEEVSKQQSKSVERQMQYDDFVEQYKELKARAAPKAKAASKGGGAGKDKVVVRKLPHDLSHISQKDAKLLMPPQSYIWKSRSDGCWHSKVPPFGEVSRSWRRYGEHQSCLLVLREAWKLHLDLNGHPYEDCLIQGLM